MIAISDIRACYVFIAGLFLGKETESIRLWIKKYAAQIYDAAYCQDILFGFIEPQAFQQPMGDGQYHLCLIGKLLHWAEDLNVS